MREDYALELKAFKPHLPMILFENYYRLEKLTRKAAEDAIAIPAQRTGFSYEPKLFKQLLKDLLSRDLDRSKGSSMVADTTETVEPPYLQIICSQLWQLDQNAPNKIIRLETYRKAKGAKGLLKSYINKVQSNFSDKDKQLTSKAFDHLISRRGTKMAYTAEDLAQTLQVNTQELQHIFEKLTDLRVLHSQQREEKIWYELYHDMFSYSIEEWNTSWKNKMQVRRTRNALVGAAIASAATYLGYDGFINYSSTHLRMNLSDPYSPVELYQGKAKSRDIFKHKHHCS